MNGDRDTYAVYDAILGSPASGAEKKSSSTVAVKDRTRIGVVCSDFSTTLDPQLRAAGEDFVKQNSTERTLIVGTFGLGRKIEVISSVELDRIFSEGTLQGWAKFHQNYPEVHGYVDLSAVGFNADKSFAVVYSGIHCGPKCGTGGFVTLSKKDGVWRRNQDRLCSWIS
jgi:hypothetical protein